MGKGDRRTRRGKIFRGTFNKKKFKKKKLKKRLAEQNAESKVSK